MAALVFDERGFGSGEYRIPWTDLQAVGIRTTADGPFAEDVFWQFLLPDRLLELPGMAINGEKIGVLQAQLAGFNNEKVIIAMGSTSERTFRLWHRDAAATAWDAPRFRARFESLIERLGGERSRAAAVFERLAAAWGEPHRRYHDREHLAECLLALERMEASPQQRDRAELALWFHDAVCQPRAHDNEERSAQLLLEEAAFLGLHEAGAAAAESVRATRHAAPDRDLSPETALVVDADLGVLGSDPLRFMEFEYAIREEFADVPTLKFLAARGQFLAGVLERELIFHTAFGAALEARARAQLGALLESPRYRSYRWTRWLPAGALA